MIVFILHSWNRQNYRVGKQTSGCQRLGIGVGWNGWLCETIYVYTTQMSACEMGEISVNSVAILMPVFWFKNCTVVMQDATTGEG